MNKPFRGRWLVFLFSDEKINTVLFFPKAPLLATHNPIML
ncbi:hypothetical protein NT07LI_0907 [Listeria innocua FSL S4-378]|nr:hypothetical protein NT07LI_0907 [Listeria innocua FSL S4-378]